MKRKICFRGKLFVYMIMPLLMLIPFGVITGIAFYLDLRVGQTVLVVMLIYAALVIAMYAVNKAVFFQELINFATQYGSVQKELLDEFEVPYALVDANGKMLWVNRRFTGLTEKEKTYHKSVTTIFPTITKELLQKEEVHSVAVVLDDRNYRVLLSRIKLSNLVQGMDMMSIQPEDAADYLTALYLFDETELNRVNIENEEQRLVAGLDRLHIIQQMEFILLHLRQEAVFEHHKILVILNLSDKRVRFGKVLIHTAIHQSDQHGLLDILHAL